MCGLEMVAQKKEKREEAKLEAVESRFQVGVTRMDKFRNVYNKGTAQIERFGKKVKD